MLPGHPTASKIYISITLLIAIFPNKKQSEAATPNSEKELFKLLTSIVIIFKLKELTYRMVRDTTEK